MTLINEHYFHATIPFCKRQKLRTSHFGIKIFKWKGYNIIFSVFSDFQDPLWRLCWLLSWEHAKEHCIQTAWEEMGCWTKRDSWYVVFFLTNYLNKHSNIKRLILSLEVVEGYRSFLTAQKEVGPEYFHSGQTRVDLWPQEFPVHQVIYS